MDYSSLAGKIPLPGADKGGAWVTMGAKSWKVAPLNFKGLRELSPQLSRLKELAPGSGQMPGPEQVDALGSVAHAALKRNYPDITLDDVLEDLDFSNFGAVLAAVMGASGLDKEPKPGEAMGVKTPPE